MWTVDEARLAAVGTVAGAGPAYAARFVRALAKAGEARGLSPEIASTIALETVLGTAWMAATANEAMDDIVKRVASPGGTTEAGLAVLDQALDELVGVTVRAAADRGAQLAEDARVQQS
jgi:pyrroline-5-carboxylate reductase